MHTTDPLFNRIDRSLAAVEDWTEERIEANVRSGIPAGDLMESLLGRLARGSINPHPTYVLGTLTSIALLRAFEIAESAMIECDEDHCWVRRDLYPRRRRIVTDALTEVVRRGPYAVAESSSPGIGGLDMRDALTGARLPVVVDAWNQLRGAVAPFAYTAAVRTAYRS